MKNEFETLARFIEKYGDDVEGRHLDELPAELKRKIGDFAHGRLAPAEMSELASALRNHPRWVGFLAQEARNAAPAGTPSKR